MATKTFPLGKLAYSGAVADRVLKDSAFAAFCARSLSRHMSCDWGEMETADKRENDFALKEGNLRIFSAYVQPGLPKIWIITEADRSVTTTLFPEDY